MHKYFFAIDAGRLRRRSVNHFVQCPLSRLLEPYFLPEVGTEKNSGSGTFHRKKMDPCYSMDKSYSLQAIQNLKILKLFHSTSRKKNRKNGQHELKVPNDLKKRTNPFIGLWVSAFSRGVSLFSTIIFCKQSFLTHLAA